LIRGFSRGGIEFITCAAVAARAGVPLVGLHVLGRLERRRHDLRHPVHQVGVEHAALRLDVGDPGVALEPHRVAGAAPRQRQRQLVLAGDHQRHQALARVERHVGVLLQVVRRGGRGVEQDGLGGGDGRAAAPEDGDVQGVQAGLLEAQLRGDLAGRVHLGDPG
jgi:hypothetical protein